MSNPVGRALVGVLRETNKLEAGAVRKQLQILAATRKELLRAVGADDPRSFRAFQRGQLLTAIDREIARARGDSVTAGSQSTREASALGGKSIDVVLSGVEQPVFSGVSSALVQAVVDVTSDSLRAVWSELGTGLKTAVRRAALGVVDPFEAQLAILRTIRDPKTFGTVETRAEMVIRTELNRTFSLASDDRLRQANARLGGSLRKWWLAANDKRTRPSHYEAGRLYALGGKPGPIPVDEPFEVGGARLMFPLDPRAPAREVVGCRCRMVPDSSSITEAVLEAWLAEVGLCGACAA